MIFSVALLLIGSPLSMDAKWTAPDQLPFPRIHSIAQTESEYYVGGLRGLSKGSPGKWSLIDERPVKQMVSAGESIWVLFGDGSIDKIEHKTQRLVFDALAGSVKRPWSSCLGFDGKGVLIGGQGGWFARGTSQTELYPKELDKQVVTTVSRFGNFGRDVWLGTQRQGLFQYTNGKAKRYGFAAGLPDSWVTATAVFEKTLIVGVADGGLVRFVKGRFEPLTSPCRKVRHLAVFDGQLVVGGMEGCWIKRGDSWHRLIDEEATFVGVVGPKLAVGSPTGLSWWQK